MFRGITAEVLNRLREGDDGSNVLDLESNGSGGRLTRRTPLGEVVIRFDHDAQRAELTVTVLKKPFFLPTIALWAEMSNALENASSAAR